MNKNRLIKKIADGDEELERILSQNKEHISPKENKKEIIKNVLQSYKPIDPWRI